MQCRNDQPVGKLQLHPTYQIDRIRNAVTKKDESIDLDNCIPQIGACLDAMNEVR